MTDMSKAEVVKSRKALQNCLETLQKTGFASANLEQVLNYQIGKADRMIYGDEPARKWSGKHYAPTDDPESDVMVLTDGTVVLGSSSARENAAYDQALRIMTTAMRALARQMRMHYTYHETKYAMKGAAWYVMNGVSRIVWEATHGEQSVVPKHQDESDLRSFTFIGDDVPEPPPLPERMVGNGRRQADGHASVGN